MAERSAASKFGATEETFRAALKDAAGSVRTPEQIALLTDEADAEKARPPDAAASVAWVPTPMFPVDRRPDDAEAHVAPVKGKGGRPLGAHNKSTAATRAYILNTFGDPLSMLARRNMMDLPALMALAKELGCEPLQLFTAQNVALAKMLPYVHSPQPQAVKIEGKGAVAFGFFGVEVDRAGDHEVDGADHFEALEAMAKRIGEDREQNQGVRLIEGTATNAGPTNAEPETPTKTGA